MKADIKGFLVEEKVFKDPVHRYVRVKRTLIWELIGTREFQRLRRIKQLGTSYLTFHGAEHSRFNHSLGVYELTRRILEHNFPKHESTKKLSDREQLLALSAALLHDIGHGPFSHSFEKVFDFHHEQFTVDMILGATEVNAILLKVDPDFPYDVARIIEKRHPNKLLVSLISSQIDVDRMDYLLRDSYYTGVSYGEFDLERLLRVIRPHNDESIVFKMSGMYAIEHFIMSRYQMYWQIYFHPVTRSAEMVLINILKRAKYLYKNDYDFAFKPVHFDSFFSDRIDLEEYIRLDESVMYFYFHEWTKETDAILSDLCYRFLNRKLFKYVNNTPKNREKVMSELERLGLDVDYYYEEDEPSKFPYEIYRKDHTGETLPIKLIDENGEVVALESQSLIVQSIMGQQRSDKKIYFPECVDLER
ncbi:MAG: HD domain-containing protein [Bacilli bacterium]